MTRRFASSKRTLIELKSMIKQVLRLSSTAFWTMRNDVFDRRGIATHYYLKGNSIEIEALHSPLNVSGKATVRDVDRLTVAELKTHYPEQKNLPLVKVDIVEDGEALTSIPPASQDFVIANHFLEHCQNPIKTIHSMLRVLKPEGILYLGTPDKRYTFDGYRPITDTIIC